MANFTKQETISVLLLNCLLYHQFKLGTCFLFIQYIIKHFKIFIDITSVKHYLKPENISYIFIKNYHRTIKRPSITGPKIGEYNFTVQNLYSYSRNMSYIRSWSFIKSSFQLRDQKFLNYLETLSLKFILIY